MQHIFFYINGTLLILFAAKVYKNVKKLLNYKKFKKLIDFYIRIW